MAKECFSFATGTPLGRTLAYELLHYLRAAIFAVKLLCTPHFYDLNSAKLFLSS